ncbi:DNA gyrase inhibitor SbmC [Buttiauxella gaviniae]|uniref:DNA gyrase inhibitor SbmC n=1 Tax=Buttiauxella gaviniae TaxID=82990 RepID=UPI003BB55976
MDVRIEQKSAEKVVGFRVIGPYAKSIPRGFQYLCDWQQRNGVPAGKWLAIYLDDPATVAPKLLRADVVFTVADDFVHPADSEKVLIQTLPAGEYAIYHVRITDGDFATPWLNFYQKVLPAIGYQLADGVGYEHYLNDYQIDGYFDLDIYQTVKKL